MSERKSNFLLQGTILALAGILSRIIGLLFRVPMLGIIGEDGMGVYNTAYNIYTIALLISSYSLPMAVSKMVSAKLAVKEYRNVALIFIESLILGASLGLIAALVMVFGAHFFASVLMSMPEAEYAIIALAPTVFIMGLLGVMRGFFQGHGTMIPTAVSQILEQILHVVISLVAGAALFQKGVEIGMENELLTAAPVGRFISYYSSAYGAVGATIGTGMGALIALLLLVFLFLLFRKEYIRRYRADDTGTQETPQAIAKMVVLTALPILISALMNNIGTLLDQNIFGAYISGDYRGIWGVYTSKYNLLINVPVAVSTALCSSTVPAISMAVARQDHDAARANASTAIRFILLISLAASVGLGFLARPCFDLLFRSTDNAAATQMMQYGSLAVVTFSLSTVTVGILQGIGRFWVPIKNALYSLLIHLPILALCLWVFHMGIEAVVLGQILLTLLLSLFNLHSLRQLDDFRKELWDGVWRLTVSALLMGIFAYGVYRFCYSLSLGNTVSLLAAIFVAILIYFALTIQTGAMTEAHLLQLPKGRFLVRLARKMRLLHKPAEEVPHE